MRLAFFVFGPVSEDRLLTNNWTKARGEAEAAFGKTQTEQLARQRSFSELDAVASAREAKTARLRELRLEKEAADASAGVAPKKKRGR